MRVIMVKTQGTRRYNWRYKEHREYNYTNTIGAHKDNRRYKSKDQCTHDMNARSKCSIRVTSGEHQTYNCRRYLVLCQTLDQFSYMAA